jgi:hypothetical protein
MTLILFLKLCSDYAFRAALFKFISVLQTDALFHWHSNENCYDNSH